jgi:hypothetical protein
MKWLSLTLLVASMVAASCGVEASGEFQYLGESGDGNSVFSYRTDRVRKDGIGNVSAWLYTSNKKPLFLMKGGKQWRPYMSSVASMVFSCTLGTFYSDTSTYYDTNGDVVATLPGSVFPQRIIPDTIADLMMRATCLQVGTPAQ